MSQREWEIIYDLKHSNEPQFQVAYSNYLGEDEEMDHPECE